MTSMNASNRTVVASVAIWLCLNSLAHASDVERALLLVKERVQALGGEDRVEPDLLEIKFRDGLRIRLRDGIPTDLAGHGLHTPFAEHLLNVVLAGAEWMRSHDISEDALERLQAEGRPQGSVQPDLNLYLRVRLPAGLDANAVAAEFQMLPEVEAVYRVPRPARAPAAPNYYNTTNVTNGHYQGYQDAAPAGIGSRSVGGLAGARGTGVTICDVEYSFNSSHVKLSAAISVGPAGVDPFNDQNHGTAVLGAYGSAAGPDGTTGIAYAAQMRFAPAQTSAGFNLGAAVTTCAANILAGDVIVIQDQLNGPNGSAFVPSEWYKPSYDAIKVVAVSRVVVEPAANGSQNLDAPIYSMGNGGHHPFLLANDSGAIMVGAGKSPAYGAEARSALQFTNYGARVDLQGWGDGVVTTGLGDLYAADGVNQLYTYSFNGTSSASAIVAGAVASLQGRSKQMRGMPLTPGEVKLTLRTYGTAQTGVNKNIGPLPDLNRAFSIFPKEPLPAPTNLRMLQ